MKQNSKVIVSALAALSLFAFTPSFAEPAKNGEDIELNKNAPDTSKSGGGGESSKNDPQPEAPAPSDGKNDPQTPPAPPPPGGNGGKNGGGNNGGGHGHNKHNTGGGGSSFDPNAGLITCVVNGRVFKVRDIRRCYTQPNYGYQETYAPAPRRHAKKHRRAHVSGGMDYAGGGGYSYGGGYGYDDGGYGYAPQPIIRYYKPASRAAVMQQQKRARRAAAAYGYGYAYEGGYGVQGGYAYGGGYAIQGGYGYQTGYPVKRKKMRRVRAQTPIYMPSYDQGYVVHYGPTISKDGGY